MTASKHSTTYFNGHRIITMMALCLFVVGFVAVAAPPKKRATKKNTDDRVHLIHANELSYDQYRAAQKDLNNANAAAQVVKGNVHFSQGGAHLTCDSAWFFQESNSVRAFGHVRFRQGDTLSLTCDRASYDGQAQRMQARQHVELHHRKQVLHTDSLDFDRLYDYAYFFDGGKLVDGKDQLVADWGEYHLDSRQAVFFYNVRLKSPDRTIDTDTLYYNVKTSMAHVVGPGSKITSEQGVITTTDGYYNTRNGQANLFSRSTIVNGDRTLTGDSLYYVKDGESRGFGNVEYIDHKRGNALTCGLFHYNQTTGEGFATRRPVARDFSQGDTLYVHSDTMRIHSFNLDTDSAYRTVHAYPHVRAYRSDIQAVCDSMVLTSIDSCMTMYRDPIVWNANRQLLGEKILIWMGDSTIRRADVIGQALSIELMSDSTHYNQLGSKMITAYFDDGAVRRTDAIGNVQAIYYPISDKDSAIIGLNFIETDTMRMTISKERQLERIWMSKAIGTLYPITQLPADKLKLTGFAWFDGIRPKDKNDIYEWRPKGNGQALKTLQRHAAPLQRINSTPKPSNSSTELPQNE